MKKLSYYLKQHIPGYLFAILSMVIAVSLDLLTPQVTRHIVDDVLVGGQMGKLKYLLLAILLIGIGRCIFQYTKEFTFDKISSTIATDMRRDLFAHIQSLSADFFDKTSTGELMARVKDDIDRIWNALGYVGVPCHRHFILHVQLKLETCDPAHALHDFLRRPCNFDGKQTRNYLRRDQ